MFTFRKSGTIVGVVLSFGLLLSSCTYMKMDPPADADKTFLNNNNTCYAATASNMLAGAGYGDGTTLQDRADDIYGDMIGHYGTADYGWTDAALQWWLGSANNTWPNNPYTVVTVHGNKIPKYPWSDANGARRIANELRTCNFVGLSISWPTNAAGQIGSGGHAITAWGDRSRMPKRGYSDPISHNPGLVRVSNSDRDDGGDVQEYRYDSFTNPNPGGSNEGNGWYFDYDPNHPYIKHIVTLSPTQTRTGGTSTVRVVGSYEIHQDQEEAATDLHYSVGTDTEILSYVTFLDWLTEESPRIQEGTPRRDELNVEWDLSENPIPQCKWVRITTEFILRAWNAMRYNDVRFTYPDRTGQMLPPIRWEVKTPQVAGADTIRNVTGGYFVGSFDLLGPSASTDSLLGRYRLLHQYDFRQDPEEHVLILSGAPGVRVQNLKVGHSYGLLEGDQLWTFEDWMTEYRETYEFDDTPVEIRVDWTGRLPYPEGENIQGRIQLEPKERPRER